jgi:hypothetical protein
MTIRCGRRLHVRWATHPEPPSRRSALLLVAAAVVVTGAAAIPAFAAGSSGVSLSVNVVAGAVKSVSVSPVSTSYVGCLYGSSTGGQLGFPDGACQGQQAVTVAENGTVPAVITVNGADMIPADNGTHWTLCTINTTCTQMLPGADQYYETISNAPGVNSGGQKGTGSFLPLTNSSTCDTIMGSPMCTFTLGQQQQEFLAMTGPSTSSDPSTSFSTNVTWTAS